VLIVNEIVGIAKNSYMIDESHLYELDSIKILDKAYYYAGGKNDSRHYEFEDVNEIPFIIDGNEYNSIINKNFIYDTLQYSNTSLTVYTDKDGYENYLKGNKSTNIQVYQFS